MAKIHQDKVAVVTGGAMGIGQAAAKRFAEDGAHVVVVDVKSAPETVKLVEATGRRALAVACDVTSEDQVAALAKQVEQAFGRCDILFNCAGIYPVQPFATMTFAQWRQIMSVNLDGVFLMCSAFAPGMRARKWGRIINVSSSTFGTVVINYAHYIASKGGVIGLTRALASELGPDGVTVNAISPSLTRTPGVLTRAPRAGFATIDAEFDRLVAIQPIKRAQTPADLVGVVSFLASEDAGFITGQNLPVDGGLVRS